MRDIRRHEVEAAFDMRQRDSVREFQRGGFGGGGERRPKQRSAREQHGAAHSGNDGILAVSVHKSPNPYVDAISADRSQAVLP